MKFLLSLLQAGCLFAYLTGTGLAKEPIERSFQLENPEGKVIAASILEVAKGSVKIRSSGRIMTVPIASFASKHGPLFEDFEKYQMRPFDINLLGERDPSIQPGKKVDFTLPALEPDASSNPAGYTIRVPENYHPWKATPVIVWFSGGRGSRDVNQALPLVDPAEFLVVCLPYPESEPRPLLAVNEGRGSKRLWAYHQAMLEDLKKRVPNISPDIRVTGGMSNGAHTVGSYLGEDVKEFVSYFNTYLLIEGGCAVNYNYSSLRNKNVYLAWGTKGSSIDLLARINGLLKGAKANVYEVPMTDVGHDFPAAEKAKCKAWIAGLSQATAKE